MVYPEGRELKKLTAFTLLKIHPVYPVSSGNTGQCPLIVENRFVGFILLFLSDDGPEADFHIIEY